MGCTPLDQPVITDRNRLLPLLGKYPAALTAAGPASDLVNRMSSGSVRLGLPLELGA